jgi:hypothetical protein
LKYRLLASWLWLASLVACDGVGRGLVDHRTSGTATSERCAEASSCGAPRTVQPAPSEPAEFGDFSTCAETAPSLISVDSFPRADCDCKNYAVQLHESSATPLVLDTGSFHHCRLQLSADRPSTLALTGVKLDDVAITLNGPVDLRLSEAQLASVRVRGSSTNAGDPSLRVNRSQVVRLALANDQDTPTELRVLDSFLADSFLQASSVQFESVALNQSTLSAQEFEASDLMVGRSVLKLDHALFSASNLNAVTIEKCGRVRLIGGEMARVEIASCREPLQLYDMIVTSSLLDGALELDDADISTSSLGTREATSLLSYNSRLVNLTLCDRVGGARLAGGLADCVACEGPLVSGEASVCSGEQLLTMEDGSNPCPAFAAINDCLSFPPRWRPN